MKAILVIDMPADCIRCPLADGYCWNTFPAKGKADGCPLKPLPKEMPMPKRKHEFGDVNYAYLMGRVRGWNKFRKKILGESDESNINY